MPDLNPLGHLLAQFNVLTMRMEEQHNTPEDIDDALSQFQASYRREKGLPSQGRVAYVEHRGVIG